MINIILNVFDIIKEKCTSSRDVVRVLKYVRVVSTYLDLLTTNIPDNAYLDLIRLETIFF